ncbi:MAG: phosphotransferase, partial [Nitrospina sp.]|nr:phosphotransferase [Nitrospina sp.]
LDRLRASSPDSESSLAMLYRYAVDAMLRMQCEARVDGLPDYSATLLRTELELFTDWFLGRHLGLEIDATLGAALRDSYAALVQVCLEQPQVFVHRDYHSRNLMVLTNADAGANPGIIDFQDAVLGPVSYDLVSLLRDAYVCFDDGAVYAWLRYYHASAQRRGWLDGVDYLTLRRWFDLTGVQRHLKVAGIFARLWHRDRKPGY